MHSPSHGGEFITETYLDELGRSGRQLAAALGAALSTVSHRILRTAAPSEMPRK